MATENMEHEKEHRSHEAFAGAPGSATDGATEMAAAINRAADYREEQFLRMEDAAKDCLRWWEQRVDRWEREMKTRAESGDYAGALGRREAAVATAMCLADLRWTLEREKSPNGCKLSDDYCGVCVSSTAPALPAGGVRSSAGLGHADGRTATV